MQPCPAHARASPRFCSSSSIARALTADEARAAISYFTRLPRTPWVSVIETEMAPRTRIIEGNLRIPVDPPAMEPLGQRIVEVPKFPVRSRAYDSHAS